MSATRQADPRPELDGLTRALSSSLDSGRRISPLQTALQKKPPLRRVLASRPIGDQAQAGPLALGSATFCSAWKPFGPWLSAVAFSTVREKREQSPRDPLGEPCLPAGAVHRFSAFVRLWPDRWRGRAGAPRLCPTMLARSSVCDSFYKSSVGEFRDDLVLHALRHEIEPVPHVKDDQL